MGPKRVNAMLTVSMLIFAALVAGCAQSAVDSQEPTLRGVISDVRTTGDQRAILVVWAEGVGDMGQIDAGYLTIDDQTTIISRTTAAGFSQDQELSSEALEPGLIVEAWIDGAIAESYPIQARAGQVDVIGQWEGDIPTPLGLTPDTQPQPESPEGRTGEPGTIETAPAE